MEKLHLHDFSEIIDYFSDNEWREFHSLYDIKETRGVGGYGVVLKAYDFKNHQYVALKIMVK